MGKMGKMGNLVANLDVLKDAGGDSQGFENILRIEIAHTVACIYVCMYGYVRVCMEKTEEKRREEKRREEKRREEKRREEKRMGAGLIQS